MTARKTLVDWYVGNPDKTGALQIGVYRVHPRGMKFEFEVDPLYGLVQIAAFGIELFFMVDVPNVVHRRLQRFMNRNVPEDHYLRRRLAFSWGEPRPYAHPTADELRAVRSSSILKFVDHATYPVDVLVESEKPKGTINIDKINVADPQSFIDAVNKKKNTE